MSFRGKKYLFNNKNVAVLQAFGKEKGKKEKGKKEEEDTGKPCARTIGHATPVSIKYKGNES